MTATLFTTTGCTRCKIVKKFMHERGIAYYEKDIRAEGKRDFQSFYRENKKCIVRGPEGIEFPIYSFEGQTRQGLGAVLAYLQGGGALDGFVHTGLLHGPWVDGIDVSRGAPESFEDLLAVLTFLKSNGINLEVETDGRNPDLLKKLMTKGMVDRGIMDLKGPKDLYDQILNEEIDLRQIEESMVLVGGLTEYRFQTTIITVFRNDGTWTYLTPDEIGETAAWLTQTTGNNKHPYILRWLSCSKTVDDDLPDMNCSAPDNLFAYRTKARRHQVKTEIKKNNYGVSS